MDNNNTPKEEDSPNILQSTDSMFRKRVTLSNPHGPDLEFSVPPTREELERIKNLPTSKMPPIYKRQLEDRIFVNRDIRLDIIKAIGCNKKNENLEFRNIS